MTRVALLLASLAWILACGSDQPTSPTTTTSSSDTERSLPGSLSQLEALTRIEARPPVTNPDQLTAETLFDHERYWPYLVSLNEDWTPPGSTGRIKASIPGVLVRLEDRRTARIDFAGQGVHTIPVEQTNLVDQARRIASGKVHKYGPNFLMTIGPRLRLSDGEATRRMGPGVMQSRVILSIFADPEGEALAEIAQALEGWRETEGLEAVLFPLGGHPDREVAEALARIEWELPYVQPGMAEAYTRSRIGGQLEAPALSLSTDEGRLLYHRAWNPQDVPGVRTLAEAQLSGAGLERANPYVIDSQAPASQVRREGSGSEGGSS